MLELEKQAGLQPFELFGAAYFSSGPVLYNTKRPPLRMCLVDSPTTLASCVTPRGHSVAIVHTFTFINTHKRYVLVQLASGFDQHLLGSFLMQKIQEQITTKEVDRSSCP
jgi:hypothetical protein